MAIVTFITVPLTPLSVYVFAAVIGFLWLSTVPPTNAVVAQIFGAQHLSMLGGFVFFSHQIGSFLGVWLGGKLYDATGSYDVVWWLAVALGVMAMLANLPVRETAITFAPASAKAVAIPRPIPRLAPTTITFFPDKLPIGSPHRQFGRFQV